MFHHRDFPINKTARCILISAFLTVLGFPRGLSAKKSDWIEVQSPHFTVLSNAGKHRAKMVALRLELIKKAMGSIMLRKPSAGRSALKVLAVYGEPSLKRLLPDYFKGHGKARPAGLFTDTLEGPYIILRTDYVDPDSYGIVFHEYVHYVMRRSIPNLPPWLVEGLADFYADTHIQGHDVLIGVADPADLRQLASHPLIPVKTLVQVGFNSPYYRDNDDVFTFYAESWALTHYLVMQDAQHQTHRLSEYTQEVSEGGNPLRTFVKIFGSTKHMDNVLIPYINRATYVAAKYPITDRLSSKTYEVSELPPAQADAVQAEFLLMRWHTEAADKLLQRALQANPRSAPANALMGLELLQKGNTLKAVAQAQKAIQLDPRDYRGYFYAALAMNSAHMSAAHAAKVEQDLTRANTLNPHLPGAQNLLAEVYLSQGQKLNLALAWALRALQEEPDNNNFLTNVETILLKQGRQADAVAFEMRMLKRAGTPKKQAQVRNQIGWTLLEQNIALQRADFEIRKANQLDPKNGDIVDSLGHLLEKEGDLPGAEAAFRHALELQPKMVSSLRGLADVLRKQHQLDKAIAEYHKALAVAPKNARVHYGLSLALKEKGDASEARTGMQTAHRLDPFNTQYQ